MLQAGINMIALNYDNSPVPVRDDLVAAHRRAWARLARHGRWWTGAERVAMAFETRHAPDCSLCRRRRSALSPYGLQGVHVRVTELTDAVVEAIHRVRTDPGRLTRSWYEGLLSTGLGDGQYVETIAVIATIVAVDTFARGLGIAPPPLPTPETGAPTQRRPKGAKLGAAWVPWIEASDVSDDECSFYPTGRPPANILKALSLVPEEAAGFFDIVEAQYLPGAAMRQFGQEFRSITHAQIELLAGRVSAINGCEY
jgi:hypothetical protein